MSDLTVFTIDNVLESLTPEQLTYKANSMLENLLRTKMKTEKKLESVHKKMEKLNEDLSELLTPKNDEIEPSDDFVLFYWYNVIDTIRNYKLWEIEAKSLEKQIEALREAVNEEKEYLKEHSSKEKEERNEEEISNDVDF